jgi:hypothetical protein
MTKNNRRQRDKGWDYALVYLALLKRGELVPVYEEAEKRARRLAAAALRRKIN